MIVFRAEKEYQEGSDLLPVLGTFLVLHNK